MSPHADMVRSLLSRGWHHAQIADHLGMCRSNVGKIAASIGLARRYQRYSSQKPPPGGRGTRCGCGAKLRLTTDALNFGALREWCPRQGCENHRQSVS